MMVATAASQSSVAWVLTAEARVAAAHIADDAYGGNGGVAVVGGAFENAVARAGASGPGTPRMDGGGGDYTDPAGASLDDGFLRSLIC